ncbi:MAG: response regulator, partial [Silvanigrellaceae bacterium]|nr:response regulator [Silvanigrellaceae bacterium]
MDGKTDEHVDLYKKFGIASPAPFASSLPIYVAEAHNEMKLIICHHLQKNGFTNIRSSRDGKSALEDLLAKPALLTIAGDDLPLVSGLDLLKDLHEEPSLTKPAFILLTKALNKNELMLALENGADDVLLKPIIPADIVPKLKSAYLAFTNPKNPERVYEFAKIKLRSNELDQAFDVYN